MMTEDQEARFALIDAESKSLGSSDPASAQKVAEIDAKNAARLKALVTEHGWLGKSLVGEDGAQAAWLLVQHADRDRAFQKNCLEKMKSALREGEVSGAQVAYLADRVAVAEGRKQIYGTQNHSPPSKPCAFEPSPIDDEEHVDSRRAAVGLPTMAQSAKRLKQTLRCK